jgi:hypothetical protein
MSSVSTVSSSSGTPSEATTCRGRGLASLLTNPDTWHSKLVRDIGYLQIFSPDLPQGLRVAPLLQHDRLRLGSDGLLDEVDDVTRGEGRGEVDVRVDLGFGRTVASETDAPNMLANLV